MTFWSSIVHLAFRTKVSCLSVMASGTQFYSSKSGSITANRPADIYLLKVNNKNTRTSCEICSKVTIKTPNDGSSIVLVSLLTLNIFHTLFQYFFANFEKVIVGWKGITTWNNGSPCLQFNMMGYLISRNCLGKEQLQDLKIASSLTKINIKIPARIKFKFLNQICNFYFWQKLSFTQFANLNSRNFKTILLFCFVCSCCKIFQLKKCDQGIY